MASSLSSVDSMLVAERVADALSLRTRHAHTLERFLRHGIDGEISTLRRATLRRLLGDLDGMADERKRSRRAGLRVGEEPPVRA
jgi:hypothetical protein